MDQPIPVESHPAGGARVVHLLSHFFHDILSLPRWHKTLLAVALAAGGAGLFVKMTTTSTGATTPPSSTSSPSGAVQPAPHSSAFNTNPAAPGVPDDTAPPTSPPGTRSPWYGRVGISIVIGFIIGWLTRAFVKLTLMAGALFAAILGALSYFHIANVDFTTAANAEYKTASAWVTDQATRLKNVAVSHIPSAGGGFVGIYMGTRRRR